ncbi:hypothetical protein PHMEG_00023280 [Phytophthora megakarya]|uniref:M96 mating-specific protein n=1 Tax=Phytophthora megakarya TaxID=4795 RepID=A0A225VH84_9STRA|nr:hypothetical protein PHMEG_00023280 [Phytophthora megakarya]
MFSPFTSTIASETPSQRYDRDSTACSPTCSDKSSENDDELLVSLFEQPKLRHSPHRNHGRGNRPFPYTRSKSRWRKRPNDELKHLRFQVIELENLIATLTHSESRMRLLTNYPTAVNDDQLQALRSLREESHNRKLKAALDENRKLRAMVASHYQVAQCLQAAVDDQIRVRARKLVWPTSAAASDKLIFALLDEEKERQYAVLDQVLEESGISQVFHPMYSSLQLDRPGKRVSFQHNEVRMLPFGVSTVAQSLRHCLSYGSRVGPSKHCREIHMYDKYFHAVTVDKVELPGSQPTEVNSKVLQLCVTKPENTVVMWSGYVEYKGSNFIRLLEKTWIVMESIPLEKMGMVTTGGNTHGTLMRVVVRLTPVETECGMQKTEDIEEMANVVINTYQRNGQRMFQAMLEQMRDTTRT